MDQEEELPEIPEEYRLLFKSICEAVTKKSENRKTAHQNILDQRKLADCQIFIPCLYDRLKPIGKKKYLAELEEKNISPKKLTKERTEGFSDSRDGSISGEERAQQAFFLSAKYHKIKPIDHLRNILLDLQNSEGRIKLGGVKGHEEVVTRLLRVGREGDLKNDESLIRDEARYASENETSRILDEKKLALHKVAKAHGYVRSTVFAEAVRLVGDGALAFAMNEIEIKTILDEFHLPEDLIGHRNKILKTLSKGVNGGLNLACRKKKFARLLSYEVGYYVASGENRLYLSFGEVSTETYFTFRQYTEQMSIEELNEYVDPELLALTGDLSLCRLHNMLDTTTTLVTVDGYILYKSLKASMSEKHAQFTSLIAEAIDSNLNSSATLAIKRMLADKHKLSKVGIANMPAPFNAVIRGAEEISGRIAGHFHNESTNNLLCLGLSFDLIAYHPSALFFGILPITFEETQKICREDNFDFFKHLRGIHLSRIQKGDYGDLAAADWTGVGKASVLRAIEFLSYWAELSRCELVDVVPKIKITTSEYNIT